jgi:formylmethanofuran dehydrogenase subunit E
MRVSETAFQVPWATAHRKRTTSMFQSPTEALSPSPPPEVYRRSSIETPIFPASNPVPTPLRRCSNCGTQDTPSWRRGDANSTLCNACGLYHSEHGRHRPFRTGTDGRTRALRTHRTRRGCSICNTQTSNMWCKDENQRQLCLKCAVYIQNKGGQVGENSEPFCE